MKKLSPLSLCLHTTVYLFRRILSIIILTFYALMRVSHEKLSVLSLCLHTNEYLFGRILSIIILASYTLMRVSDEKLSPLSLCLHINVYLFRRTLSIIVVTYGHMALNITLNIYACTLYTDDYVTFSRLPLWSGVCNPT